MPVALFIAGIQGIGIDRKLNDAVTEIIAFTDYRAFKFPEPTRYGGDQEVFGLEPDGRVNGVDGPGGFFCWLFHTHYSVSEISFLKSVKLCPEAFLKNLLK